MDTPVSELSTFDELISGIAISASVIAVVFGVPILSEKIADGICAMTQKVEKMLVQYLANYLKFSKLLKEAIHSEH